MNTTLRYAVFFSLFLALMAALTHHAHGQNAELPGDWTLVFEIPEDSNPQFPLTLAWDDESLIVSAVVEGEPLPVESMWDNGTLTMDIDIGHALIVCTMIYEDDSFTGICKGPQAEISSHMVRQE
jgi:hypothetical protein